METFNTIGAIIGIISGIMSILGVEGLSKWKIFQKPKYSSETPPESSKSKRKPRNKSKSSTLNTSTFLFSKSIWRTIFIVSLIQGVITFTTYDITMGTTWYSLFYFIIFIWISHYIIKSSYNDFFVENFTFGKRFKVAFFPNLIIGIIGSIVSWYIFNILDPFYYEEFLLKQFQEQGLPDDAIEQAMQSSLGYTKGWTLLFTSLIGVLFSASLVSLIAALLTRKMA